MLTDQISKKVSLGDLDIRVSPSRRSPSDTGVNLLVDNIVIKYFDSYTAALDHSIAIVNGDL